MCSEGGCCGPCCSARSWFVTHIVFVMLSVVGTLSWIGAGSLERSVALEVELRMGITNQLGTTAVALHVLVLIANVLWIISGWIAVCTENVKALIAYVVLAAVDLLLRSILLIIFVSQLDEIEQNSEYSVTGRLLPLTIEMLCLDVPPMICLCACRAAVLSRYSEGRRPNAGGIVYHQAGTQPQGQDMQAYPQQQPYNATEKT